MKKPIDLSKVNSMTDDEYHRFVMESLLGGWIPLKLYMKYVPTETKLAIETRLHRGVWKKGVHYSLPHRGAPWVNLIAIRAWVGGNKLDEVQFEGGEAGRQLAKELKPDS